MKKIETSIVIFSLTFHKWQYKLRYKYKDIYKNVFIDKYKQTKCCLRL